MRGAPKRICRVKRGMVVMRVRRRERIAVCLLVSFARHITSVWIWGCGMCRKKHTKAFCPI